MGRPVKLMSDLGELNGILRAFGSETLSLMGREQSFLRAEWAVFTAPPLVVLPTTLGLYVRGDLQSGYMALVTRLTPEGWKEYGSTEVMTDLYFLTEWQRDGVLTRLRPEAEVAAEVLADLAAILSQPFNGWTTQAAAQLDLLAAKWATK